MNIKIRAIRENDIWVLHQWINDPEVIQYTNAFRPISEMEQKEWFANTKYFKNNYVFGIEDIDDKKLIGTCGLYDPDHIAHKAELRMKIAESNYRGKGLGREALNQLLSFGFRDLNLNKIWLRVLSNNIPALQIYLKAGFQKEGVMRKDMFIRGNYHDVIVMSLLKEEYERN
jgi:RimJ/RimL family protein N-acetyltransferase